VLEKLTGEADGSERQAIEALDLTFVGDDEFAASAPRSMSSTRPAAMREFAMTPR